MNIIGKWILLKNILNNSIPKAYTFYVLIDKWIMIQKYRIPRINPPDINSLTSKKAQVRRFQSYLEGGRKEQREGGPGWERGTEMGNRRRRWRRERYSSKDPKEMYSKTLAFSTGGLGDLSGSSSINLRRHTTYCSQPRWLSVESRPQAKALDRLHP